MAVKHKLTIKQKRFVDEYIISTNATQAAINAGYSVKTARQMGSELLSKPYIRAAIDEYMDKLDNKSIAGKNEVLAYFTSVMRGESESEMVVVEGQGNGISKAKRILKKPSETERLDAAKQLAKRHGLDKSDIENAVMAVQIVDDVE